MSIIEKDKDVVAQVLAKKTKADLEGAAPEPKDPTRGSNLIPITEEHVDMVLDLHTQGKSVVEIRHTLKMSGHNRRGLSRQQVLYIIDGIQKKAEGEAC